MPQVRSSRGGQIRTADLTVPNRALYQAKLRPDTAIPSFKEALCFLATKLGESVQKALWPSPPRFLAEKERAVPPKLCR